MRDGTRGSFEAAVPLEPGVTLTAEKVPKTKNEVVSSEVVEAASAPCTCAAAAPSLQIQRLGVGWRASSVLQGLPPGHPAHRRAQGIPGEEFHGLGGFLAAPAGRGHSISKMPRTSPYSPNFEHLFRQKITPP